MTRIRVAQMLVAPALMALVIQPTGRARADAVTDWNVVAINATAVPPNSILQSRVLATVHGAIYDAVRAVDQKGAAHAVDLKAPAGTSLDAAVAAATADAPPSRNTSAMWENVPAPPEAITGIDTAAVTRATVSTS